MRLRLLLALTALAVGVVAAPLAATPNVPQVANWAVTDNLTAVGFSERNVPFPPNTSGSFNSDLAFQGDIVVQGTYAGFRLIDVEKPSRPKEIVNWEECQSAANANGNQGDVIIWENLIIRSWNSPTPAPQYPGGGTIPTSDPLRFTTPGAHCGNWPMYRVPATGPFPERGQEGVHVIDISNPTSPNVVAFVDTLCGSHTETLVPDLENNRLLIYNNSSAGTFLGGDPGEPHQPTSCRGFDIIEVPLANPAAASYLRFVPAGDPNEPADMHHPCHDTGVILGKAMMVACAGSGVGGAGEGPGAAVYTIDPAKGGAKDNPKFLYYKVTGGISLGHSATFTYDGKVIVVGHEPGGGSGARCQATTNPLERTFFFVEAATGASLGQFTIPRVQTNTENCTTHNLNIVPLKNKGGKPRYVAVSGNYQSGISIFEFTDPANPVEIAYADPPPLSTTSLVLGGDWSTYWYNGRIYQSDIRRGLFIWRLDDDRVGTFYKETRSNPQTQTFTINAIGSGITE